MGGRVGLAAAAAMQHLMLDAPFLILEGSCRFFQAKHKEYKHQLLNKEFYLQGQYPAKEVPVHKLESMHEPDPAGGLHV